MNSTKEVKNNMTCTVESDTETSVLLQYICGMWNKNQTGF